MNHSFAKPQAPIHYRTLTEYNVENMFGNEDKTSDEVNVSNMIKPLHYKFISSDTDIKTNNENTDSINV